MTELRERVGPAEKLGLDSVTRESKQQVLMEVNSDRVGLRTGIRSATVGSVASMKELIL